MSRNGDRLITDMRRLSITELPVSLQDNSIVVVLDLSENNLKSLLFSPLGLKVLILDNNLFSSVPEAIFSLRSLEKLMFNRNMLEVIPFSILALENLRVLSVNHNKLTRLPELPNSLVTLKASNNRLEDTSMIYKPGCRLKHIDFSYNLIHIIEADIIRLESLKTLNLSNNHISKLSSLIFSMKALRKLDLSYNKLADLSSDEDKAMNRNLAYLNLSYNKIHLIPEYIGNLIGLESLQLQGNNTIIFQCTLEKMKRLHTLDLSRNTCIMPVFLSAMSLPSLKILKASYSNLEYFPELTKDSNLEILILAGNEISSLPQSIRYLKKLRILNLSHRDGTCTKHQLRYLLKANDIIKLPDDIACLECLEVLNLDKTGITELPDNIKRLKRLRKLNIGYKGDFILPDGIGDLESLEVISCVECIPACCFGTIIDKCQNMTDLMNHSQKLSSSKGFSIVRPAVEIGLPIKVPSTLRKLSRLCVLKLGDGIITSEDIFNSLASLRVLSAFNLMIKQEVLDLSLLQNLRVLDLKSDLINKSLIIIRGDQKQDIVSGALNLRAMRISERIFRGIQDRIRELENFHTLVLDGSSLRSFDSSSLKSLKKLKLSNFHTISGDIGELPSLRDLTIDCPLLVEFPKPFTMLKNLERFKFSCLDIKKMFGVSEMVRVESISIELDNNPSRMSIWVDKLRRLVDISTTDSNTLSLPNIIGRVDSITSLGLIGYRIFEFPLWICSLINLTSLDISNTHIAELPPNIGDLVNMKVFTAESCDIQTLPEEFGKLNSLEKLSIRSISFVRLPKYFKNLTRLKVLEITFTSLESLRESHKETKSQPELNQKAELDISLIPAEVYSSCISGMSNLEILNIEKNKLTKLPDDIGTLCSLIELNISSNNITELPESIRNLKLLRYLDISNNKITLLPEWIEDLKYLCTLDIRKNTIKTIPKGIYKLCYLISFKRDL